MKDFLSNIPRRWIGALAGLIIALMLLKFGFWRLLFICLCAGLGYVVGQLIEGDQSLEHLIQRLFPSR